MSSAGADGDRAVGDVERREVVATASAPAGSRRRGRAARRSITLPSAPPRISASAQPNRRWPPWRASSQTMKTAAASPSADEEPALPAARVVEERERGAAVVGADDVEERRHRARVAELERARRSSPWSAGRGRSPRRRCRARAAATPGCAPPSRVRARLAGAEQVGRAAAADRRVRRVAPTSLR